MLFFQVILPVYLIILSGFLLEKSQRLDFKPLTVTSLYLFAPALVFSALLRQRIEAELATDLLLFTLFYTLILWMIAALSGRLLRMAGDERRALVLTTAMMNVGNFGLPLVLFAFGESALGVSILIFVLFNIPLGTLAIVLAQGSAKHWKKVLVDTLKIPIFHAVALAFLCKGLQVQPPEALLKPLELLGQAAVPVMLVLLGMQLARTRLFAAWRFLSLSIVLRLVAAPAIAWGLTLLLGISGLAAKVAILQTSTPAAVLPLLYSLRFGTRPDLIAGAIFLSTILSAGSLTFLLSLLNG